MDRRERQRGGWTESRGRGGWAGAFFGPLIIQLGMIVWGVLALFFFCKLVNYSELHPAWLKYLLCSVAAGFGAAAAILAYCGLFLTAPWVAILLVTVLLVWAVFAICRVLIPPSPDGE